MGRAPRTTERSPELHCETSRRQSRCPRGRAHPIIGGRRPPAVEGSPEHLARSYGGSPVRHSSAGPPVPWLLPCLRPSGSHTHGSVVSVFLPRFGGAANSCVSLTVQSVGPRVRDAGFDQKKGSPCRAWLSLGGTFHTICADSPIMLLVHSEIEP